VVEHVIHGEAEPELNAVTVELEVDGILQLGVEREKGREAASLVLRAEIPKSGVFATLKMR